MRTFAKVLGVLVLWVVLLLVIAWGSAALWFDHPASLPLAGVLAAVYALASLALLIKVRPWGRASAAVLVLFAVVLVWWLSLAPSNDRDWQRDVARLATVDIQGDTVTIHNVRNFDYRSATDYTERWETRTYDLSKVQGLDLFLIYWGSPSIAHTILSWQFHDGPPLAISIETRKEEAESYSAIRGFFRQYELYYVVADENDVARLRSNYRNEDVYLYRLRTPPARARAILLDYLETINQLAGEPRWYNALIHNCTTNIRMHANNVVGGIPSDWRWLANGYLDQLLYEYGVLNREVPFTELKSSSYVNPKAKALSPDDTYSEVIRVDLPERSPPPEN